MKIAVFDTHVQGSDGRHLHFDILVDAEQRHDVDAVLRFGQTYLAAIGQGGATLTTRECRFCHTELAEPATQAAIQADGFAIIELN